MKAVVAAFNQEKALVEAFSVLTNLRMELFQALVSTRLFEGPGEDEVCELEADPGLSAGQVAHVDQDGVEGDAGLVRQLLLVQ